jgi:hypothetical protein
MKEYKGWEIAKMICEGELKEGDLIQNEYGDIFEIKNHHLVYCESDKELGSSYFGGDFNYKILQKPVDFMDVVNSGKRCRVEYPNAPEGSWHLDDMLYWLGSESSSELCAEIIKKGKWYIEEDEKS